MAKIDTLKKLISNTALYGISLIIGRAINYLIVPLHTSILTPTSYGIMTELYIYVAFGNIFLSSGMELAYFRFANKEKESLLFNSIMSIICIFCVIFSIILVAVAAFVPWFQNKNHYIYYLIGILVTDTLYILPFARLRFYKKSLLFCSLKIFQTILNVILNFLLLYNKAYVIIDLTWLKLLISSDIDCVFFANLISNMITIILILLFSKTLPSFKFSFCWEQFKPILQYTLPLMLTNIPYMINEMLSRLMLRYLLPSNFYPQHHSNDVVGIFSACYKLTSLLAFWLRAFQQAAEPFFFDHFRYKDAKILFNQVMHLFIMSSCFILLVLTLNLETIGRVLLRNTIYREGLNIVPYLAFSYLLSGIYYNISIWFKITNKVYYGASITICGALITIACNIYLVPFLGYWGCVWATLVNAIVRVSCCYFWGKKHYPISYNLQGIWYIVITLCLVKVIRSITYPFSLISVGITSLLTLLLTIVFYILCRRWWITQSKKG